MQPAAFARARLASTRMVLLCLWPALRAVRRSGCPGGQRPAGSPGLACSAGATACQPALALPCAAPGPAMLQLIDYLIEGAYQRYLERRGGQPHTAACHEQALCADEHTHHAAVVGAIASMHTGQAHLAGAVQAAAQHKHECCPHETPEEHVQHGHDQAHQHQHPHGGEGHDLEAGHAHKHAHGHTHSPEGSGKLGSVELPAATGSGDMVDDGGECLCVCVWVGGAGRGGSKMEGLVSAGVCRAARRLGLGLWLRCPPSRATPAGWTSMPLPPTPLRLHPGPFSAPPSPPSQHRARSTAPAAPP